MDDPATETNGAKLGPPSSNVSVPSSDNYRRRRVPGLVTDSLIYTLAGAAGKLLGLVTVPYLSRSLGPSDYGLLDLAIATAFVMSTIAMLGADIPAARLAAETEALSARRRIYGRYLSATVVASLLISAVAVVAAPMVASVIWNEPASVNLVLLSFLLVPISTAQATLVVIQRLDARPKSFALLQIVDLSAQVTLATLFVLIGFGVEGAVTGLVVGSTVGLAAAWYAGRRIVTVTLDASGMWELAIRGLPFLPAVLAFVAADYASRAIIASSPSGAAGVGWFAIAIRIASVMGLLVAGFQLAWGPRALARQPSAETARLFGRVGVAYSVLGGAGSVIVACMAPELVGVVSGIEFLPAAVALPGLAISAFLGGSNYILAMGAGISGRNWSVATSSLVGAGTQIIATAIAVGQMGMLGVGLAAVVGRLVGFGLLAARVYPVFDSGLWIAITIALGSAPIALALGALGGDTTSSALRISLAVLTAIGAALLYRSQIRDFTRRRIPN